MEKSHQRFTLLMLNYHFLDDKKQVLKNASSIKSFSKMINELYSGLIEVHDKVSNKSIKECEKYIQLIKNSKVEDLYSKKFEYI